VRAHTVPHMATPQEQARYQQARRHVRAIRGFYIHATVFVAVNALLHVINLVTTRDVYWAFWPLVGWGIGLAAHGLATLRPLPFLGREWEERKIRELLDKDRPPGTG
jgi:2TM domain-containing protein